MNALINSRQPDVLTEVEENEIDTQTVGEIFAIALVSLLVIVVFTVSTWSAILLFTGNTEGGGPIGFIFNLIRTTALG